MLKRIWAKAQLAFGSSPQWIRSLHKAAPMTFNTARRQRAPQWLLQNKDVLRRTSRGRSRAWGLLSLQNSSEVRLWLLNLKTQQHLQGHHWWGVKDLLNLNKPVLGTQTETKRVNMLWRAQICLPALLCHLINCWPINISTILAQFKRMSSAAYNPAQ